MATRDIRTSSQDTVCDVCGRTLLRGERADPYLDGAARREVCELCKDRALHEGWVREGTVTAYDDGEMQTDRRRSLLGRLRPRRDPPGSLAQPPTLRDELDSHAWSQEARARDLEPPARAARERRSSSGLRRPRPGARPAPQAGASPPREPRHVRAVPASVEQKVASAASLFNASEHPRTVAGVSRSLGAPGVCLIPSANSPSLVGVTVWWELCWYRYEVDLSDEVPSVRQIEQGYELSELTPVEQQANAAANDRGELLLGG